MLVAGLLFANCASANYDVHDDPTVSTHVKIALIDDARLGEFRLNASTLHGIVTLHGSVPSQGDADHAIAVARKVRGVRDVRSELTIGGRWPVAGGRWPVASCQLPVASYQFGFQVPVLGSR
jgi:hypothetical protein